LYSTFALSAIRFTGVSSLFINLDDLLTMWF
jgi:hypothetical protein